MSTRRIHHGAHRLFVGRQRLNASHQYVEQPVARGLIGHFTIAAREHFLVDVLDMRSKDSEGRTEFGAQLRQLYPSPTCDFGKSDLVERPIGKKRHERFDRLLAIGIAARRRRGW